MIAIVLCKSLDISFAKEIKMVLMHMDTTYCCDTKMRLRQNQAFSSKIWVLCHCHLFEPHRQIGN